MEQALPVKALGLVTRSLSIALIFIVGTLAYSGWQEATSMTQSLSGQGLGGTIVMNATHLSISDLTIDNRGLYPLILSLEGEFTLERSTLGSSSFGPLTIPPGSRGRIDFSLPLQIGSALRDPALVRKVLFNGTSMMLRLKVAGEIEPFLTIMLSGGINSTIGPMLDGFNVKAGTPTLHNETHAKVPIVIGFTNKSPLPLDVTLSARIISTPLRPAVGDYGYGSAKISTPPEEYFEESLDIYVAKDTVGQGSYLVEFNLTGQGFTYTWTATLEG